MSEDQARNAAAASILAEVRSLDPEQPVYEVRTMQDVVGRSVSRQWLTTLLADLFAVMALLLAGLGVYGVISYSVTLRQREIGVRIALGAAPQSVRRMIARQGARLGVAGVSIGLILAIALTRLLRGLLFEITPTDPATLAGTCCALLASAAVASWIPARRAAAVDPAEALRQS